MKIKPFTAGIPVFTVTWLGQVVSLVGSGLTSFALGVWVFRSTGSATLFAFIGLFAVLPKVLVSPFAGALVDRWDRRAVMILADTGAGLSTLFIATILIFDRMELWHIYLSTAASSLFGAFQWPAYTAAVSLLVPEEHLGRANGMNQFGRAAAEIFAPLLAGILMLTIQLEGVILIDVGTFIFAMLTLLLVRFPRLKTTPRANDDRPFKRDLAFGWRYILAQKGLRILLAFQAAVEFIWGLVGALIVPMILSFTTAANLGALVTIAGTGMLVGSLVMTAWGGPKNRTQGIFLFEFICGICFIVMGFRPEFWWVAGGAFGAHLTIAIVFGSNQALWQAIVEPEKQGRVFSAQQMAASAAAPLAYLLAGPLAENIFEPLMAVGGTLSRSLGPSLEYGVGRGIGLMFILLGLVKSIISVFGTLNPRLRSLNDKLPEVIPGAGD